MAVAVPLTATLALDRLGEGQHVIEQALVDLDRQLQGYKARAVQQPALPKL
jgi:hypothetical protein